MAARQLAALALALLALVALAAPALAFEERMELAADSEQLSHAAAAAAGEALGQPPSIAELQKQFAAQLAKYRASAKKTIQPKSADNSATVNALNKKYSRRSQRSAFSARGPLAGVPPMQFRKQLKAKRPKRKAPLHKAYKNPVTKPVAKESALKRKRAKKAASGSGNAKAAAKASTKSKKAGSKVRFLSVEAEGALEAHVDSESGVDGPVFGSGHAVSSSGGGASQSGRKGGDAGGGASQSGRKGGDAGGGASQSGRKGGDAGGDASQSGRKGGDAGGDASQSGRKGGDAGGDASQSGRKGGDAGGDASQSGRKGGDAGGSSSQSGRKGGNGGPISGEYRPLNQQEYDDATTVTVQDIWDNLASAGVSQDTIAAVKKSLTVGRDVMKCNGFQNVNPTASCGNCWAHTAAYAMSMLRPRDTIMKTPIGMVSAQMIVDCVRGGDSDGCNGGSPMDALDWAASNPLAGVTGYPVTSNIVINGGQQTCQTPTGPTAIMSYGWSMAVPACGASPDCWKNAAQEVALLELLNTNFFPLVIVYVDATNWQFYSSGLFPVSACSDSLEAGNHVVYLCGYGIDKDSGLPYWKLCNSWGTIDNVWGEGGGIRVPFGVNACGLANFAVRVKENPNSPYPYLTMARPRDSGP